jgi:O-antigen/teichoic acid export membrane protein
MIRKLAHQSWFKDELLRKLFKNAAILFSGSAGASVLGLISLALTARALGVEQFGVLVLITTYVLIVDKLINFQSWQALIKYGAETLEQKRDFDFKSLIKFGFLLDGSTAILGALLAAGAAGFTGQWLGWNQEQIVMAIAYSITVIFHINGTPIAILRIFNKFKKTAIQQVYAAAFKLIGVTLAYLMGAGLWAFLLIWALTDILGNLLLIYYAFKELKNQKIKGVFKASTAKIGNRFKGMWGFVLTTNLNSSIRMTSRELDIMLVAAILGPAASGLYKIAKQFTSVIQKTIDPLYQAVYPDLVRLYTAGKLPQFIRFGIRSSILAGIIALSIWLFFYVTADYVLLWTVGSEYLDAKGVMLWCMFAAVIAAAGFPLQPIMLSMGRAHTTLWVHVASTIIYFSALFSLLEQIGLIGAGIAYVIYYAAWSLLMLVIEAVIFRGKKLSYANEP